MNKSKKIGIQFLLITILLSGCISKEAAQEEKKIVPLAEKPQPQIEIIDNEDSESKVELVIGPNDIPPVEESKFKEGVYIEWADIEDKMDKGAIGTLQTVLETIINQDLTTYDAQLRSDVKDSVPITGQDIFFTEDKDKEFMFYGIDTIEKVYKTKSEYYYNVVVICMEATEEITQHSYSFVITKKDEEWKLYMVD